MARCMLKAKELLKIFWAEAVYIVVYLLNKLPNKVVEVKTLVAAWFGSKPSASHLKVFGSICYMLVPDVKRIKLDDKVELGIFLGYAATFNGLQNLQCENKEVVFNRDVKFDEGAYWDFKKEQVIGAINSVQ